MAGEPGALSSYFPMAGSGCPPGNRCQLAGEADAVYLGRQPGKVQGVKPLTSLADIPKEEFDKAPPRPSGYTSQSRIFIGGMGLGCLFDTGASCIGIREEEVMDLLNHTQGQLAQGKLSIESPSYPIKRLEVLTAREEMTGLAAESPVHVANCIVLRVEFRPASEEPGPVRDMVVKVFPKVSSTFPGLIIGMPALDVPPYGLGYRIAATSSTG